MFCLRSYLVLLFLPINASPIFIVSFFILTYLLNRPCVYCSILLVILFVSSCYWSDQCFFDLSSNWFEPRPAAIHPVPAAISGALPSGSSTTSLSDTKFLLHALNDTAVALAGAAVEELKRRVGSSPKSADIASAASTAAAATAASDTEWARSWMGSWRIPCLDVNIRL